MEIEKQQEQTEEAKEEPQEPVQESRGLFNVDPNFLELPHEGFKQSELDEFSIA